MAHRLRRHVIFRLFLVTALLVGISHFFTAFGQFTQGNVVVLQVGTGTGTLVNTGNPILLREFTPTGVAATTVTIPSSGGNALQASGTATSEGFLTRSTDGKSLILTGYRAAAGNASSLPASTAAAIPRGIYTVDAAGTINTSTALTDYSSGGSPRSAASADGTAFWAVGGAGGTRYAASGATTSTQVNSDVTNLRQISIVNGQLYASTGSGSATRLGTIGTGQPTTSGQTFSNLPGITTTNLPSPYAFFFADLSPGVPGVDVLYVADDSGTGGGILKFSLVSGSWTLNGALGAAADAYRGLVGTASGSSVTLYATRKGNELVSVTDATGYNVAPSGTPTLLATAPTNTAFRGVAFAPTASTAQPSLAVNPTSLDLGTTATGNPGTPQSYTISASSLTATVGVTTPTGVEVSTLTVGPYSNSLTLPQSTTSATIYARLTGAVSGSISGNITTASGSQSATVAISGNVVSVSATVLASTAAICPGDPVNFSLTVSGLTAGVTYSYTLSNGTNSTTASGLSASAVTTSVVPTVAGSFTATVLTSLNSTTTATTGNIALNSLPTNASLTSGTLTCAATSVTLTASASGASSYTLLGGASAQTSTTGQFVVSAAGDYTAIIANTSGCTASATATVGSSTGIPVATLTTSGTLTCAQPSVTLTASGGTSYTFSAGATQIGSTNQAVVTAAGLYSVTVASANGCTSTTNVTVESNTTAPTVSINASTTTLSTATPTASLTAIGTGTVRWSTAESTSVITVSTAGTYSVVLTGANGCTATASATITSGTTPPSAGSIVISQVYGGGGNSGATFRNDFIELFNRGGSPVNIQGWSIQHTSATGTTWNVTSLTGTIGPGQYYLVQQAAGTGGTVNLPTPDAIGTATMGATSGKVALVNNNVALTISCPTGASIVDFVGYGTTANCFEGIGPTPAPGNTTAVLRASDGCTDANQNATDFTAGAPNPRNSASPANPCVPIGPTLAATPNPVVVSYVVGTGPASQTFAVSGSSLDPASGSITVTSSSTNVTLSTDGSTFAASVTVAYAGGTLANTTLTARLIAGLSVGTYPATLTVVGGSASTTLAVAGTVTNAGGTPTLISVIQGTGRTSPLVGQSVTVEGIVTRAFPGTTALNGFFVQEEDSDSDGNPLTSEGIFCFDPTGVLTGNVGDRIRVVGTVAEFVTTASGITSTLTQLTGLSGFQNLGAGTLPAATTVTFPVAAASGGVSFLERFEAMFITARANSGNLIVTDHFNLGRFGQLLLSAADPATSPSGGDARIYQYTQFNLPSVAGYANYTATTALREIYVDDASGVQNPAIILFGRGGNPLSASNTLRGGDGIGSITTVLDERFEGYRLQSNVGLNFQPLNPRPATPPAVGGSLKVAGANILNFFNGPSFPTSRGADTQQEYDRQLPKIVANLIGTQADIVAVSELQNNGYGPGSAAQALITALNSSPLNTAGDSYTFVNPGTSTGSDEITMALLYKTNKVSLVGSAAVIPNSFGNGAFDVVGRKPVAQTFRHTATGGVLTVVGNHWKSKGSSSGGPGDADAGDGQALSNGTRTRQAQDLAAWLATNPTGTTDPDYLVLGDLNSYAQEDPIRSLTANGYTALLPASSYSFLFNGEWGSLDHALSTTSLTGQVTGATKWYVNADEPRVLDYNTESKTPAQITSLFAPDQYRSADHDPLVVGFNLTGSLSATLLASTSAVCTGDPVNFSITVGGLATGQTYSYTLSNGTNSTTASGLSASVVTASIVPTVAGPFSVTVLTSAASSTTATSGNIALNTLPTNASLTSGTLTCAATSVTLTASATGGTSYTLLGGVSPQTNTTGQFVVTAAGTYTAIIANASSCTASAIAMVSSNTTAPMATLAASTSAGVASNTLTCAVTSLTLTAGGGTSYTFVGPGLVSQNAASGTAVVNAPGTYTVTVSSGNGCTATASTVISQSATLPTATLAASGTLTCTVTSVTLTATGGNGYAFSGPGVLSQNATAGTAVVNASGTYSVTVNNTATGCFSTTTTTVSSNTTAPTATLTASRTAVCTPGSVTLTAGTGVSYAFSGPGLSQLGTSATAVVSQGGTFSVVVTGSNGCTASAGIVINSSPTPAAPALSGASLTVAASTTPFQLTTLVTATGSNTLTFFNSGGPVVPPVANVSAAGVQTFSVVQTNVAGCVSPATVFSLTVISPLPPTSQSTCRGSNVVLNALPNGVSYQWFRHASLTAPGARLTDVASLYRGTTTASLTLVSIQTTSYYSCQVTQANGTVLTYGPFAVNVTLCGSRVNAEPDLAVAVRVAPNPITDGLLQATIRGAGGQRLTVTLTDEQGRLVREQQWPEAAQEQHVEWNVADRPAGLLLLRATTDRQIQTVKVLKK